MPITTVEFINRIARRARDGGDFTKLSLNEVLDVLTAANSALQHLYNALPIYFKEQTQGFVLPAPLAIASIGVTQFGKTVTGYTFTEAQIGQTVVLDGDAGWNQIIGEDELLNPYMGPTGTVQGTIYGNAVYSPTIPLDRIVGNPVYVNQNLTPIASLTMGRANAQNGGGWLLQQTIGMPQVWWPQSFGNSQGRSPIMCLRFAPAPDQAYAINVRIAFWAKRLTRDDYAANTELPVPDQFIDTALIPIALGQFLTSPAWQTRGDEDKVLQAAQDGEVFLRQQPGQVGAPNNQVYCPTGY